MAESPTMDAEVTAGMAPRDRLEDAYVRHAGSALRLAYFLTGRRDLAEDLVQEAFARMAARLVYLRAPESVEAYLRRSIVNLFTSSLRRRRRERAWLAAQRPDDVSTDPDPAARDEVWRALRALAPRQRAAIVLRYHEDLSEEDAATVLGCSKRALNSLVVRGMQTLRATLTPGDEP